MKTAHYDRFPAQPPIVLPEFAVSLGRMSYRLGDETVVVWPGHYMTRIENGKSVVRHTCGVLWPTDATDIEIEYEPAAIEPEDE